MTKFDEVKWLKELETKAEPEWRRGESGSIYCKKSDRYPLMTPYGINSSSAEVQLTVDLRNAAPWLLEVAGKFQKGDVDMLRDILSDIHEREDYPGQAVFATDCLRRMAEAAEIMEGE